MHAKLLSSEAIFSPKCGKYRSAAGLPQIRLGAYSTPLDPLIGIRSPTSKRKEKEGTRRKGMKGERRR